MEQYGYTPIRRPRPDPRRGIILGLLGLAFFLTLLDGTIVYVALPQIQRELGFGSGDVHWVMTAYLLGFGGFLLFGGRLSDIFGRRRMFMVGIAVFATGSLLGGIAPTPAALVAARAVQGIGAAVVAPTILPLLVAHIDDGPGRGRALTVWTVIGAFAGTAGLLIGGPLTDAAGWQSIFLINVPLGVALLALSPVVLRSVAVRNARRGFDLAGALTLAAAVVCLVVAVSGAGRTGWTSAQTIGLLGLSAVLFAVFARIELRAREPLVAPRLLRSRTRLGGMLVLLVAGIVADGFFVLLTLYMQHVLEFSATVFGLLATVMTLSAVLGSFAGQALVLRIGLRPLTIVGLALMGVGCLLLTAVPAGGDFVGDVLPGLLVFGPGLGATFVSAQIAVVSGAAAPDSAPAASIADTAFSIGGALGLAALSSMMVSQGRGALADPSLLPSPIDLTAGFRYAFSGAVGVVVVGVVAALALLRRRAPGPPPLPRP